MSMTPEDTIPSDVAVPERDADLSEAARSGDRARAAGQEPTQTQKAAMKDSKLPNDGLSPDYAEDKVEDRTGILPDHDRS